MEERQLQTWLNAGSIVLVAVLVASFVAVIRASLSAG